MNVVPLSTADAATLLVESIVVCAVLVTVSSCKKEEINQNELPKKLNSNQNK